MKRRVVRVVEARFEDIEVGDVIHRDPESKAGWFEVAKISTLFDGRTQLADESEQSTASGAGMDIVGLQLSAEVEIDPETGYVVEAAAPAPVVSVAQAPMPEPVPAPVPTPASVPSPSPEPEPESDLESAASEATPAAPIGEPAGAPVADVPVQELPVKPVPLAVPPVPEVDLSEVLTALTNLDVGDEQPAIAYETADARADVTPAGGDLGERSEPPRRSTDPDTVTWVRRSPDLSPDIPAVAMPEGAEPVYGDTLPDSPSYLTPVLVRDPVANPLPSRRRQRS